MKARLVEDKQNFERKQHPRASLGIGGVVYQDEFSKDYKNLVDKWTNKLTKDLTGKTITTECIKYTEDSLSERHKPKGTFTFKVAEVLEPGMNFDFVSMKGDKDIYLSLWVLDGDGNRYDLGVLDKKIYID
jgi:hypothetical protein